MARWVALVQTAMHNVHSLPPEILDLIVEGLTIQDNQSTAASGADAGRWIRAFRNVVHLRVNQHPLALFHGLSPTVKSLRLEFWRAQLSEIFDLMCTFPLLEDFALLVYGYEDDLDGRPTPSTSPRLTGSFELRSVVEISPITRRLLDLPNGLNFMEVALTCAQEKDFRSTTDFVEGCSNTLEFFRFVDFFTGEVPSVTVPDRCLTATLQSPAHGDFVQPLHGRETQTTGVSVHATWRPMGHRGAPNCRIQGPSRNHLAIRPQGSGTRVSSTMAGPGPPVGPILDFAFDPPKGHVWDWDGKGYEKLCPEYVAGANWERTH